MEGRREEEKGLSKRREKEGLREGVEKKCGGRVSESDASVSFAVEIAILFIVSASWCNSATENV